jgi:hypothetical protein
VNLPDPNSSDSELSDAVLIAEFKHPKKYKKKNLYALMSKRADSSFEIRKLLFEVILDPCARKEVEVGIITHAWLPVLLILEYSNENVKLQLKEILRQWSRDEKELFLTYIGKDKEYYSFLKDLREY